MINLASIAQHYRADFERAYGDRMTHVHSRALDQIIRCHTPQAGALLYHCGTCHLNTTLYPSCGHRHCPACQHQVNGHWLERQRKKLLPVNYYLVTFTLPAQLRRFVWTHQSWAYQAMFQAAQETLLSFFERDKKLGENPGFTGVLHTHSKNLTFHPHVHFVVPGGSLNKGKTRWQKKSGKYLFKADNLAQVFRGKLIALMSKANYYLPIGTPQEWNADCQFVGKGDGALTYLARYLYRGVINENNILTLTNDRVTFQYKNSDTKQFETITEPAIEFLWRMIQHVLPKGFRRARDFGFLHGNAKKALMRLQLVLKVIIRVQPTVQKRAVRCPQCQSAMELYLMRIGRHLIIANTI